MFPPPAPWKQLVPVDPVREYVAFTSRFFLKSVRRLPALMARGGPIQEQLKTAPGLVGWSLGGDLFKLEFHTLSAWEDADSLQRFVREGGHGAALRALASDTRRPSLFVYYQVLGRDLPLKWKDAVARQERQRQLQDAVRQG